MYTVLTCICYIIIKETIRPEVSLVEKTLKITNVLSDPTRYSIYEFITKRHKDVTVQEIAEHFDIHPNVARLHLSKLEDVNMLVSETKKTGKGGRPSRLYRLSEKVIQLNFPYRDYQLLAKIALESLFSLGESAKEALYETGKRFGTEYMESEIAKRHLTEELTFEQKLEIFKDAAELAGFSPEFEYDKEESVIYLQIYNCPFKELAHSHYETVCPTHRQFLRGMFESLFGPVTLTEKENIVDGCDSCSYKAKVSN